MIFRILILAIHSLAFSLNVYAIEVSFKSLKPLIETKNERVRAQKKKAVAAKLREGALSRSYLPKVTASGGYETFKVGTGPSKQQPYLALEASINLYNGGTDRLQDKVQELNSLRRQNEVKITSAEQLWQARELFWQLVYLKSENTLLSTMQKINDKNLISANRRIKSGIATPSDRLEFKMKQLDLKRSLQQNQSKFKTLSFGLLVHLGYDISEPIQINGELQHIDEWEQELKHTHLDHDFFTKPSELGAEILNIKRLQEKRSWLPRVDLYASWFQHNQREEDPIPASERAESAIGIKFSMDLFNGLLSKQEAGALYAESNAATLLSLFDKKQTEAKIETEFLELKELHDQVHEAENHIAMAEKYYKATQSEYMRGAKNSPDVLSATERLEHVRRVKNQLIRDFQIARSHVMSKIGK